MGRLDGTARKRFNDNKKHFIEGVDYFKVKCSEVRPFFGQTPPNWFNLDTDLILVTEMGYLMIVKSFKDIDAVHKRPSGTAHRNFKANRSRFIEGVDYFKVRADEIRLNKIWDIS